MMAKGISEESASCYLDKYREMLSLYEQGKTLEQIGDRYGITKQRVHQIIRRCKIGDGDYYKAVSIEKEIQNDESVDLVDWLDGKGVKTIERKSVLELN